MKIFLNTLRWLFFVLILIIGFWIAGLALDYIFDALVKLSSGWVLVILIFAGGFFMWVFTFLSGIIGSIVLIAPNKTVGAFIFSGLALVFLILNAIAYWSIWSGHNWFIQLLAVITASLFWVMLIISSFAVSKN